ncbi:hypothetical protein ACHAXH_000266 [Discostella pseudostelligera]
MNAAAMTNNVAATSTSTRTPRARAVSFSEFSSLICVSNDEDDHVTKSTKWYTSNERQRFRQTLMDDVRQVSHGINELSPDGIMTPEQLCGCLGIEMFINRAAAKSAVRSKRAHILAVLSEQRRQIHLGIYDPEELSIIQEGILWYEREGAEACIRLCLLVIFECEGLRRRERQPLRTCDCE